MSNQMDVIGAKLNHLDKMRQYLEYSFARMKELRIADQDFSGLSADKAEAFAAFRLRFSEYQEHLGKLVTAIAREEEIPIRGGSDVAAFAVKMNFVQTEAEWKEPRDSRNSINHDYDESSHELREIVVKMLSEVDLLITIHKGIVAFCHDTYALENSFDETVATVADSPSSESLPSMG